MVAPEPLRGMTADVVPSKSPGPDTSSRTIVVAWFTVVGCPAVSSTLTTTLNGRSWTGPPSPDAVSVIDTISRDPLTGAALAGIEIPMAHAAVSKAAPSTARRRRISDCLRVGDCLGVIFFPPRTLHALAIKV
jgi:hypothetical protein